MKPQQFWLLLALGLLICPIAGATEADDTTITIAGHTAGPTPFISQVSLVASQAAVLKKFQFTITPKTGAVSRALSGTYSADYLTERGDLTERQAKSSSRFTASTRVPRTQSPSNTTSPTALPRKTASR